MLEGDSLVIDAELIDADLCPNYVVVERPDIETIPFLLRVNYACRSPNIKALLSAATHLGLYICCILTAVMNSAAWLVLSPLIDLFCNVIGYYCLKQYPRHFRTDRPNLLVSAMAAETFTILFRALQTAIIVGSLFVQDYDFGWIFFSFSFLLMLSTYVFGQSMAFTSVYNFINLLTCSLFMLKYHSEVDIPWRTVFWCQKALGYVSIAAAVGYFIFWSVVIVKKYQSTAQASWPSIISNLVFCVNVACSSLLVFGLEADLKDSIPWTRIDLITAGILAASACLLQLTVSLIFQNRLVFSLGFETEIVTKKDLSYSMKVIQLTATSFVQSLNQSPDTSSFPSKVACFVCQGHISNCLLMDCLHSGICHVCAPNWLKINHLCPSCEKPISKIVVIAELEKKTEHLVIAEISRAE